MSGERFFDTNILFYAFDESEGAKHATAKALVEEITEGKAQGIVSNQVLAELFSSLTMKMKGRMTKEEAYAIVKGFISAPSWRKINYTASTVSKAMRRPVENCTPFWDALIVETMAENGVYTLLTENIKDFESGPIKAVNPFK